MIEIGGGNRPRAALVQGRAKTFSDGQTFIDGQISMGRYRGASLIRNSGGLAPYSRTMPRALWQSLGGWAVSYGRGTPVLSLLEKVKTSEANTVVLRTISTLDVLATGVPRS